MQDIENRNYDEGFSPEEENEEGKMLEPEGSAAGGQDAPEMNAESQGATDRPPGFLEVIYGVFFSPAATFRSMVQYPMIGRAILFYSLVVGLFGISWTAMTHAIVPEFMGRQMIIVFPLLGILANMIGWFLGTAVYQLVAEFQGGKGRGVSLFSALGFAHAPVLLVTPAALLLAVSFPRLYNWVSFLIYIWIVVLSVIAIRSIHNFSTGKAIWTMVIPLISFLIFFIITGVLVFLVFMNMGAEFPGIPGL